MTALADLLKPADRRHLLEHLDEADQLDHLMRKPGGLPAVPEPVPLRHVGRGRVTTTLFTEPANMLFTGRADGDRDA